MTSPRLRSCVLLVCATSMAWLTAGCSSSSSDSSNTQPAAAPAPGTYTTLRGTFAGGGGSEGGAIEIRITNGLHGRTAGGLAFDTLHPLAAVNPVSATLKLSAGGPAITLDGALAETDYALAMSGGGYTFNAPLATNMVGSYTGPKGAGAFTAVASPSVTTYCGTFSGDAKGVWNFVVNEVGTLTGSASDDKGNPDTLAGNVADGVVTLATKNGSTGTGMVSGATATGTYANGAVKGTWTGTAGCGI